MYLLIVGKKAFAIFGKWGLGRVARMHFHPLAEKIAAAIVRRLHSTRGGYA
jgi:hypothetical protein